MTPRRWVHVAVVGLLLVCVLRAGKGSVGAAEPVQGIASTWQGPGAATPDCRWPWTDCQTRAVRSLQTGLVIIVTPQMYCNCYVGRVGPNGETERLIDLDPAQVAALGLDRAQGLFPIEVWTVGPGSGLPDTAMAQP